MKKKNVAHLRPLLDNLPEVSGCSWTVEKDAVIISSRESLSNEDSAMIADVAARLIIWRKGPFELFGLKIDSEWQSGFKWKRLENDLPSLQNKRILDVGASSGYYMFRMAHHNPKMVLGIDPSAKFRYQFEFIQKFARQQNMFYELLGVEHLDFLPACFDVIFCMGVLYHRKDPIKTLKTLKTCLAPGGILVLETLMIPGEGAMILNPEISYGKMKNVYAIPSYSTLEAWCRESGFRNIYKSSISQTTVEEQRNTEYCPAPSQSLSDFLDPDDPDKTIEGYPAHRRVTLIAS